MENRSRKNAEEQKKDDKKTKRRIPPAVREGLLHYLAKRGRIKSNSVEPTSPTGTGTGPGRGNSNKTEPCAQCEKPKPYQRKDKLCSDCRTEMIGDSVYQYDIENLPGGGDSGVASYAERYRDEYG